MIRTLLVIGAALFVIGAIGITPEFYANYPLFGLEGVLVAAVLMTLGAAIFMAGIGTFLQDLIKSRKP